MKKTDKTGDDLSELLNLSDPLAKTILNSLSANIAILDDRGVILETNDAWRGYADEHDLKGRNDSIGVNYLNICDQATGEGARDARRVAQGIRNVIAGTVKEFQYEYPCHTPTGRAWYYVRALRMAVDAPVRIVVSHEDITPLKLAEEAARKREQERNRLQDSLALAMEVQQTLLPKCDPVIEGFDISGRSVYCDETGGDYYDYFDLGNRRLAVVIGDVSGHGISSALLMAAVRSALRQRSFHPGSISQIISDINRQFTLDVSDAGQFVTLFYLVIDPTEKMLKWVRAGNMPGLYYHAAQDRFEELKGPGMALGIHESAVYQENEKKALAKGDVILLATDGIWEVRNPRGDMIDRGNILDTIRRNRSAGAGSIIDAVMAYIVKFQGKKGPEDDLTLVVIKAMGDE